MAALGINMADLSASTTGIFVGDAALLATGVAAFEAAAIEVFGLSRRTSRRIAPTRADARGRGPPPSLRWRSRPRCAQFQKRLLVLAWPAQGPK